MVRATKIAVLGGDGVGPEVTAETVKVLEATGHKFEFIEADVGGKAYIEKGNPLPDDAREAVEDSDAVLFGAVGHDYAPYGIPRKVLVYLRMEKNAYANVRPLKLYPGVKQLPDGSPYRDVDVVIVRDNAEGISLEHEGYLWDEKGVDKRVITHYGAQRIAMFALKYAAKKGRRKITCIDQSNWLYSDKLFRSAFERVASMEKGIEFDSVSVDVAAMMQVMNPKRFDVILTPDLYGDIISGVVIGQIGGVGMAPSACIGDDFAFFEPVHGTAWDIAGKGVANPLASILSGKLMMEWLGFQDVANRIEYAVSSVLVDGKVRTVDIGGKSRTVEVGDAVAALLGGDPVVDVVDIGLVDDVPVEG
jgi:isocitrate/isopropylmalate dehydrogenase